MIDSSPFSRNDTESTTWDEAARAAVTYVENEASFIQNTGANLDSTLEEYEKAISEHVLGLDKHAFDTQDMLNCMLGMGVQAIMWVRDNYPRYSNSGMVDLLVRKQHDYGHDNINNFGLVGIAIRMCDKVARIRNLTKRGDDAQNESIVDSYMDLIGYAAIAFMYDNGGFQLPLEGDMA